MYKRQALTEPLVIRNGGTGGGTNVGMVFYNGNESSTGAGALAKIKAIDVGNYDSDLVFETGLKSGWSNTGTIERLRIDSAGRCIVGGGTHAGGSALVVKGGNQNSYSTIGMFSNHTNPSDNTCLLYTSDAADEE